MTMKIPDGMGHLLGQVVGASSPTVAWTPEALADMERARRKFAFWARWHPLSSRRAKYRAALAVLDGLRQGVRVASFYEWATEMGKRHAAVEKK